MQISFVLSGIRDYEPISSSSSRALGLFTASSELYRWKNVSYTCLHLTLQEFLAAFYIFHQTASEQKKLFMEHRKKEHLNVVWRFVCGLVWEVVGKEMERILGLSVTETYVFIYPSFVQCLYEAQDKEICRNIFHQKWVNYVGIESSLFDVYAVAYCVACSKYSDWSINLGYCGLEPELVDILAQGLKSVEYGGAIVGQLYLSNNHITDEGMQHFQQLSPYVLRWIRELHLSKCGISQRGMDILGDLIPGMCNLTSLDIGNNPVGEGGMVKLLQELGKLHTIQSLNMELVLIGESEIAVLPHLIRPKGVLRELWIGHHDMSPELVESFVRTVVSPSSLDLLVMFVPLYPSPLDYIDSISDSLTKISLKASYTSFVKYKSTTNSLSSSLSPASPYTHLSPQDTSSKQSTAKSTVKGGTRFSRLFRKNTMSTKFSRLVRNNKKLEHLALIIPLDKDELMDIIASVSHNKSLNEFLLSPVFHSYIYESKSEKLDRRIEWHK